MAKQNQGSPKAEWGAPEQDREETLARDLFARMVVDRQQSTTAHVAGQAIEAARDFYKVWDEKQTPPGGSK